MSVSKKILPMLSNTHSPPLLQQLDMSLYDPERVSSIAEIMPRFAAHVQPGDRLMLGISDDPLFPEDYRYERPEGTVVHVKALDDSGEHTTVRMRMDNGSIVDLHPGTVDPERLWEYTDASYQKVLERTSPEPAYRGSGGADNPVQELRNEIAQMRADYDNELQDVRVFNNTLLATLHEMASDVCNTSSNAPFCSVFVSEYKNMMKNEAVDAKPSAFFNSDVESDDDYDDDVM